VTSRTQYRYVKKVAFFSGHGVYCLLFVRILDKLFLLRPICLIFSCLLCFALLYFCGVYVLSMKTATITGTTTTTTTGPTTTTTTTTGVWFTYIYITCSCKLNMYAQFTFQCMTFKFNSSLLNNKYTLHRQVW